MNWTKSVTLVKCGLLELLTERARPSQTKVIWYRLHCYDRQQHSKDQTHSSCLSHRKWTSAHCSKAHCYLFILKWHGWNYSDPVMIVCSESSHQILIHTACAINAPYPPWLLLGVKRERQIGIGGGVTTVKDKEQSLFGVGWRSEGTWGLRGPLLNTGLPCFHDSTAETAKRQQPFLLLKG